MPIFFPVPFNWKYVNVLASRALLLTDAFQWLDVDNALAVNITVPDPALVDFEVGTQIALEQIGAGAFTMVAGANVTLNSRGALLISNGQFSVVSLALKSTGAVSVWTVFGDLA